MITRRKLLIALGASALASPLTSHAQPQNKIWRIGLLRTGSPPDPLFDAFVEGFRDLGYVEGKNISIERRYAHGDMARLPALAAELVRLKVDVIFAPNTPAVEAAKQVTGTIPIVFCSVGEPVGSGFVSSLARPGGNMTGLTIMAPEVGGKRLQLLKDLSPRTARVAMFRQLASIETASNTLQVEEIRRAAKTLGMEILPTQLGHREEFKQVLELLRKWRTDAIYITEHPTNFFNRQLLVEFVAAARLPAVWPSIEYTEVGGLMSYGPSYASLYRRAAAYVDKILKGAKPSDLPVEQPTTFDLVINMSTAKTFGITMPQSLLLQATRVIE
jgi:ABC-type uncharacterized transport system substrate-binding protein